MLTWLLTSTTYGTWLPGDPRGFVGRVTDQREGESQVSHRIEHDQSDTPCDRGIPGRQRSAAKLMKGEPVLLSFEQAVVVRDQFLATAKYRTWMIPAIAVMNNHIHLVVSAEDAALTETLLRDFKSYASRALNVKWPKPQSGTWWTQSGSRRKLPDERAVQAGIRYVLNQHAALALSPDPRAEGVSPPREP